MTSKELVTAALQGRPIPRVPVGPLAVHFCAREAGYNLRQYSTHPHNLADSVLRYYERFRPDAVWISADTWISAEAMGARVEAIDDDQPLGGVGEPFIRTVADINRIPPPDVGQHGRYPVMLEALHRVVEVIGGDVFVVACFDQYPFSLAAALMGLSEFMLRLHDDPPFVLALIARCEEYAFAYARALANAGADMLSGGDSPAGLAGPQHYRTFALPAEQRVIAALKKTTQKPISLHICGDARPILPLMASSGADVLELDHVVDPAVACRCIGPNVALWGNVDPVGVLVEGTPESVRHVAQSVIAAVRAAGHPRFVLSSGCTLAVETPAANLRALIAAR
jgi:uroporphyrinogen decarboxylase